MSDLGRLRYRDPDLVTDLLDHVYQAEAAVPWDELVDRHTSDHHPWKTVEATMYDLVAFGALHRVGKPSTRSRPDTRALKPTTLGRAWLDQDLTPLVGATDSEEDR